MTRTRERQPRLALVVREELRDLGVWRRAARLTKLVFFSGFTSAPAWMTMTTLVMIGSAAAMVCYPLGYRLMVDAILNHNDAGAAAGAAVTASVFSIGWALTIVGSTQMSGLTDRVNIWLAAHVGELLASVRTLEHFERPDYLAEVALLTQNRRDLAAASGKTLSLALSVLRTLLIAVLLSSIFPLLALLPFAGFVPLFADDLGVRIQERTTQRLAEHTRLSQALFNILTTAGDAEELRISGIQEELTTRYRRLVREIQRAAIRASLLAFLLEAVGWVVYAVVFGGAIVLLITRAVQGQASAGDVVMAIALIRRAQGQVGGVSDAFGQMITNLRTARRLMWLESLADRTRHPVVKAVPLDPPERLTDYIRLDHVSFTYPGTDRPVLTDVNVTLRPGTTVAIVGENGAGKTTLVKLLMKLYEPTSGQILVDDVSLAEIDVEAWRARSTAIFQDFVRYEMQVRHIVGVGDLPRLDDDEAVLAALGTIEGLDVVDALDDGLATQIGWTFPEGRNLSGGQWQKLALGRGLMRERPLVAVLDEPTSSLDARAEATLFSRLTRTADQVASSDGIILFVSHRFPSARIADLIIVLDKGTVIETGNHATLLSQGGAYAEMFELQARAYR
jgi:ATP-binding cassette, subfamily B, bacterial